jgi:hypothetical protein
VDHVRARRGGQHGRAVRGGVVGHDHLPGDPLPLEDVERRAHAQLDVLLLVEAGDDDRDEELTALDVVGGQSGGGAFDGAHGGGSGEGDPSRTVR